MKDNQGREYAQLSKLRQGDMIKADKGFDCLGEGPHVVHYSEDGLYVKCACGRHYLEGQLPYNNESDHLVGIYPVK